jgi:hypothetical protein
MPLRMPQPEEPGAGGGGGDEERDPVGGAEVAVLQEIEAGGGRRPGEQDGVGAGLQNGQQRRGGRLGIPPARSACDLFLWFYRGWAVFDPGELFLGEAATGFEFFCEWCVEMSSGTVGRKCLLVDEAWKYVNVRKHPAELERAVHGGRHVEPDCLFTTQTPG